MVLLVAGAVVVAFVVRLYLVVDKAPGPGPQTVASAPLTPVLPSVTPRPPAAPPPDAQGPPTPIAMSGARSEREQLVAHIHDDLTGHEAWSQTGLAILDAAAQGSSAVTDRGCYMAGCIATITYPSRDAYERALVELGSSAAYAAWTGAKQVTPPEIRSDGSVVVAVALLRPD